ncbi:hypothetical protein [Legionella feeleii]|uniref:Transmembrane protein n=1 Tax=Legionella feeleii TaxID=453 RepID=A0A0W0TNC7_9GAMM|nr:hypothetical protein [Legionella feeleii]KTC96741.1 hypothetical protein Lfee_1653 [Legionella feeleii]SPX60587.1 Uncharacterised protein [Legionella feeleii]
MDVIKTNDAVYNSGVKLTNTITKKPNYIIHLIYAGSFLLAVSLVIAYLVWSKNQLAIRHKELEEKIRINEQKRLVQEREHKIKIKLCMNKAMELYSQDWAEACIQQNRKNKNGFENCRNRADAYVKYMKTSYTTTEESARLYNYQLAQCKSLYSFSNKPNLNCSLPTTLAHSVNAGLKKYEQTCREII